MLCCVFRQRYSRAASTAQVGAGPTLDTLANFFSFVAYFSSVVFFSSVAYSARGKAVRRAPQCHKVKSLAKAYPLPSGEGGGY